MGENKYIEIVLVDVRFNKAVSPAPRVRAEENVDAQIKRPGAALEVHWPRVLRFCLFHNTRVIYARPVHFHTRHIRSRGRTVGAMHSQHTRHIRSRGRTVGAMHSQHTRHIRSRGRTVGAMHSQHTRHIRSRGRTVGAMHSPGLRSRQTRLQRGPAGRACCVFVCFTTHASYTKSWADGGCHAFSRSPQSTNSVAKRPGWPRKEAVILGMSWPAFYTAVRRGFGVRGTKASAALW